jgi:CheY-like chemotaxis protein
MPNETRILVIDDDEIVLVAIADLLENVGFMVFTQASPIGATQTIARDRIDLVVIDLNMPVMKGDTVIRLLRTWDRMRDLPVVVISGADESTLGAIKQALPDVLIVRKLEMARDLVPTVHEAMVRRAAPGPRSTASEVPSSGSDLAHQFVTELARFLPRVRALTSREAKEDIHERLSVIRLLDKNRERAQLLGLVSLGSVIEHASRALMGMRSSGAAGESSARVFVAAIDSLERLQRIDASRIPEEMEHALQRLGRLS